MTDGEPHLRVIAFAERTAQTGGPSSLQVYVVNESPTVLGILGDLDSINVPEDSSADVEANWTHIDFGVPGTATYVQVAPGECVKITLLLGDEQFDLLARVKRMKTTVRFRDEGDENAEVTTALVAATVYRVNP
jgi:hypothetical protein